MKNFPDPALTAISRKLRDVDFEPDDALDGAAESLTTMHGVQPFPVNKSNPGAPREYAVTLYVAQKVRIIGKTKWRAAACRFADMAKLRFYKFKQRGAVEPKDDELNFSVAQAKSDLQFVESAVAILDEIEAHFREKGFWKDVIEKEVRNKSSARWTVSNAVRALETEIEIIKEKLDGLLTLAQLQPEVFKRSASSVDNNAIHDKTDAVNFEVNRKREITRMQELELLKSQLVKEGTQAITDPIAELLPT